MARALAWHARGRRFDPDTLHSTGVRQIFEQYTGFLFPETLSTTGQKILDCASPFTQADWRTSIKFFGKATRKSNYRKPLMGGTGCLIGIIALYLRDHVMSHIYTHLRQVIELAWLAGFRVSEVVASLRKSIYSKYLFTESPTSYVLVTLFFAINTPILV